MRKVVYKGDLQVIIPSLGVEVKPGDVIDVPDDFVNANFIPYVEKKSSTKEATE